MCSSAAADYSRFGRCHFPAISARNRSGRRPRRDMMRRKIAAALLALGTVLPAQAADKVKVTYPTLTTSFIFFFAAIDKGFYAEENLDLDVVEAGGGIATPA